MSYKEHWTKMKCRKVDNKFIPFDKLAPTWLQKGDEHKLFNTQKEVDKAWSEGWHAVNRPETADIPKKEDKNNGGNSTKSRN